MEKTKLHQIVAVINGKKTETKKELTDLHKRCQRADLFNGLRRHYQPLDEDGEVLPDEIKNVQEDAEAILDEVKTIMTDLLDVVATQDWNNCDANADVVVDDKVVLEKVPVSHLLFLEKQLTDMETFFSKLPVLEATDKWTKDEQTGEWVTEHYVTNRSQKELKHKVLVEATEYHPAQVEKWNVDAVVGKWDNQKFSTAVPVAKRKDLVGRVRKLKDAVKFARETANDKEVEQVKVGKKIFDYLYSPS